MTKQLQFKKLFITMVAFVCLTGIFLPGSGMGQATEQFNNPVWDNGGADPWIYQESGMYYFTYTQGARIVIYKIGDITNLGGLVASKPAYSVVYTPPSHMKNIWAPELHKINGKWYVYFAADDGTNANHRMYVIENPDPDPTTGNWTLKGQVGDVTNNWAIDGTILELNDEIYMLWSGWISASERTQCIYIARLSDPWTVASTRVMLSRPEYAWERNGLALNEGPAVLKNAAGEVFVTFSGSHFSSDDYCLGLLTLTPGANPMLASSWTKSPTPVFSRNDAGQVYGPGHNGFFKSPDGTEDWIVYHARTYPNGGSDNKRNVRIQPVSWNLDGSPDFGTAVGIDQTIDAPSRNFDLPAGAFSTIWKTNLTDANASTISFNATGNNFLIHWEDMDNPANTGDVTGVNGLNTVSFPTPGTYMVSIAQGSGQFTAFELGTGTPASLLSVEQWGNTPWTTFKNAFYRGENFEIHAKDAPDLSLVTDMSGAFRGCKSMVKNTAMASWNTSNVKDINRIFQDATALNQPLNDWDVSSVERMDFAFYKTTLFNQPLDKWDVSSVTNMSNLFFGNAHFNQPLGMWDVSNVKNIGHVLQGAVIYDQDLSQWDVSSAENMAYMFFGASSFNSDISQWDVSKVTNMVRLLAGATSFDQNLGDWDLSSVAPPNPGGDGSLVNALSNTGISCSNYSLTLKGWAENPSTPDNLTLTATGRFYDDAFTTTYRNTLINDKGWTITGDNLGNCTVEDDRLPVRITSFTGSLSRGTATLQWQTAFESGVDYFELEAVYSRHGQAPQGDFKSLGKQAAKNNAGNYSISVAQNEAEAYYRLKMVDQDGSFSYHPELVHLSQAVDGTIEVYPNPATDYVTVRTKAAGTGRLYSAGGTLVRTVQLNAGVNRVELSGLSAGVYFFETGGERIKLIKK